MKAQVVAGFVLTAVVSGVVYLVWGPLSGGRALATLAGFAVMVPLLLGFRSIAKRRGW